MAGPNGGVTYIAAYAGPAGNSIRVRHVVAGNNTPLSVSVTDNDVTVNLATNGSGVAISTADEVVQLIRESTPASALVRAVSSGTGEGVASASGFVSLANGVNELAGASGEELENLIERVVAQVELGLPSHVDLIDTIQMDVQASLNLQSTVEPTIT